MHARLFDMLHNAGDDHLRAVRDRVHIHFNGVRQKFIQQDRGRIGHAHGLVHVASEIVFAIYDLHRPAAEHIRGPHHERITDRPGRGHGLLDIARRGIGRLFEAEFMQQFLKAFPVFSQINGIRAGADDRRAGRGQLARELQRRLPAVLDDHAVWLFNMDDLQHIFQRQRLKIQAIRGVVIGRDRLGIAVDHDRLIAGLAHGKGRLHAAVIKLNALTDPVGAAAQHHDLLPIRGPRLAFVLVTGIKIGRGGRKLGGAGIHPLVNRADIFFRSECPELGLADGQQFRQSRIGKALAFQRPEPPSGQRRQPALFDLCFLPDQILDLGQKPMIDMAEGMDFRYRKPVAEGIRHIPEPFGARRPELMFNAFARIQGAPADHFIKPGQPDLHAPDRLLQGFLKGAPERHHLADRFHLRGQAVVRLVKFLEGKTRDLADDIINAGFKRGRRGAARDLIIQFVQRITDGQPGRDLGDGEAGRLGGERRGTRDPRVHFNDDQLAVFRINGELHIGAAGVHADLAQDRDRGVAHLLIFAVGEGLRGRDRDRVAGVHAHGVEVFDGTDDDAVVLVIAHHFHLVFLPAQHRSFDQHLGGGRGLQPAFADRQIFIAVIGNAAARAAQGERGPDNRGKTDALDASFGLFQVMREHGFRHLQADPAHRLAELFAILGLVDGRL